MSGQQQGLSAEEREGIEALAVEICSHSGRHTAGDGDHDAEQWGPCCQCRHYARVVAPILVARLDALTAENDRLAGVVAAVEVLAEEWEGWARNRSTPRIDAFRDAAERLRAALGAGGEVER